jgi:hypothetical protein
MRIGQRLGRAPERPAEATPVLARRHPRECVEAGRSQAARHVEAHSLAAAHLRPVELEEALLLPLEPAAVGRLRLLV